MFSHPGSSYSHLKVTKRAQKFWLTCITVTLTLSWWGKFSRVIFHVSSTLVCQILLLAQSIEMSMTKTVFLWYGSKNDVHFFCKLRMMCTWTKNKEKRSYHNREFSGYRRKWVKLSRSLQFNWAREFSGIHFNIRVWNKFITNVKMQASIKFFPLQNHWN